MEIRGEEGKRREAHPIAPIIEYLTPPLPLTYVAQVCSTYTMLIKESLCRCPVILLWLMCASTCILPEQGIYVLCECLECGKVLPGTWAYRMHEGDTKRGEVEATLAVLGGLVLVEDAYAMLGVLDKVTVAV
jgi:hypothetical protein